MGAVNSEKLSKHTTQNSNSKQNESNYLTQNKKENKAWKSVFAIKTSKLHFLKKNK